MSKLSIVSIAFIFFIICSWPVMAVYINGGYGGSAGEVSFGIASNLDDSTSLLSTITLGQSTLDKETEASGSGDNSINEYISNGDDGVSQNVISSGSMDMQSSTIASKSGIATSQQTNLIGDKGYVANRMTSPSEDLGLTASFSGTGGYLNSKTESVTSGSSNIAGSVKIMGDEYLDPEAAETINSLKGTVLKSTEGLYLTQDNNIGSFGLIILKQDYAAGSTWIWGDKNKPKYRWPDNPKLRLWLNTQNIPTGISLTTAAKTINDAANNWDKKTSQDLFNGDENSASNAVVSTSSLYKPNFNIYDYRNVLGFSALSDPNTIAVTNTWYYTSGLTAKGDGASLGRAIDSDCKFNTKFKWSILPSNTAFELGDIAQHELGHTLGLPDFYDNSQSSWVMYGYRGLTDAPRTLTSDDIGMLQYLYGP